MKKFLHSLWEQKEKKRVQHWNKALCTLVDLHHVAAEYWMQNNTQNTKATGMRIESLVRSDWRAPRDGHTDGFRAKELIMESSPEEA